VLPVLPWLNLSQCSRFDLTSTEFGLAKLAKLNALNTSHRSSSPTRSVSCVVFDAFSFFSLRQMEAISTLKWLLWITFARCESEVDILRARRKITEQTVLYGVLVAPLSVICFRVRDYSVPKLNAVEGANVQRPISILVTKASEPPALALWNALVVAGKLSDEVLPAT
jgi:hypothetical protein